MAQAIEWTAEASEGVRLFNAGRYFEAHDVFEAIWLGKVGDERSFYQGLIQVAVGCYKLRGRNLGGARSQLRRGIDKLERTRHLVVPIDTERLLAGARIMLARLEAAQGGGSIGEFDCSFALSIQFSERS